MRALVTGITGFVGGHLAEHLVACGDSVTGCSRSGQWPRALSHLRDAVDLEPRDLSLPSDAQALFASEPFDCVFHLAGLANPRACTTDPVRAHRDNVETTRNLYQAIEISGQRPRIVFVSSSYVYGRPKPEFNPITTNCAVDVTHAYAATKWAGELLSIRFAESAGLIIVRARPFNHIGARQPVGYVVSDWAQQIAAIESGAAAPVLHVGNLETRRDYMDVRDVVRAYRLLACEHSIAGVYNLGSGRGTSGQELLDTLQRLSRRSWTTESDPARVRAVEAMELVADIQPVREHVGWQPTIELTTTLQDTLNYWRGASNENRTNSASASALSDTGPAIPRSHRATEPQGGRS